MATMRTLAQPSRFSVYVGNLPYQTTEDAIGNYFNQAGRVTNVKILCDRETGRPKGFGFCEFSDEAGAQNADNTLNGADFNGRACELDQQKLTLDLIPKIFAVVQIWLHFPNVLLLLCYRQLNVCNMYFVQ